MKTLNKRKFSTAIGLSIVFMLLFSIMLLFSVTVSSKAYAESETPSNFIFTLITNDNGEEEYKVALDSTERPTIEKIIIPSIWNGKPVTEIADGGFMSCAKLKTVILPEFIRKIGRNAFANNASLQRVNLSKVKEIGANAFAMCPLLDKLFIPNSVKNVGATILRNNPNTIYIESSLNDVQANWDANWSANRAGGTIEYGVTLDDVVFYREVYDTSAQQSRSVANVIGYEIYGFAWLYEPTDDLIIYSSYKGDDGEYKPVLNIAPEAFAYSTLNSLTIKHKHIDDPTFQVFNHSINIMSAAFKSTWIRKINIEVDVTLNHTDLPSIGSETFEPVEGDEYAKSKEIFADATVVEINFTKILDSVIGQKMFSSCSYLKKLTINGNAENRLPSVERIGKEAFNKCTSIDSISIPSSVQTIEENVFYDWGKTQKQTINIDQYEGNAIVGLERERLQKSFNNISNVTINYIVLEYSVRYYPNKPSKASNSVSGSMSNSTHIYYLDSTLNKNTFSLTGWRFLRWNTDSDGAGTSYNDGATIKTLIEEDGATVNLFAQWVQNTYSVALNSNGGINGSTSTTATFDNSMPIGLKAPIRTGYEFQGYYTGINGAGVKYYDKNMNGVRMWNIASASTLYAYWKPCSYTVTLNKQNGTGGSSSVTAIYNSAMPSAYAPTREGFDFGGYWTGENGTGTQYYSLNMSSVRNWNIAESRILYAKWTAKTLNVAIEYSYYDMQANGEVFIPVSETYTIPWNQEYVFTAPYEYTNKMCGTVYFRFYNPTRTGPGNLADKISDSYFTINDRTFTLHAGTDLIGKTIYINPYYIPTDSECIAEGTLITLYDGSQKPVEQLNNNDMLLVWNMYTGTFDSAPIIFVDQDAPKTYKVISLLFSDETVVKIIGEHGFWDFNLNQFVYLDMNAANYIGHWFNKQICSANGSLDWNKVQLVNVSVKDEYTTAWSPVTYRHLCYYVNGMLSMPGGISGLFNYFEVDNETMTINQQEYSKDLAEYGLFTYEEFAALFPISKEIFNAFNAQYFKVAIGKGLLTQEQIIYLIERYSHFWL